MPEIVDPRIWIKDKNVVEFRAKAQQTDDTKSIVSGAKHVEAAGVLLTSPLAGDMLPWWKSHPNFRFRTKEFSVWAGANSAGKSLMLGEVSLGLMQQGKRVAMISLEMPAERTLARMLRQAAGTGDTTRFFEKRFEEWLTDKFFVYEKTTSLTPRRAIDIIDYCAAELGADHIFLDSLMKCNVGADTFAAQKAFIEALSVASKRNNAHVHLVAHFGKPKHGLKTDRYAIKGPTEISDIADNVLLMVRNRNKAREMEKPPEERDEKKIHQSDGHLTVDKQRNGEWDGEIHLWFHRESMQYVGHEGGRPIDFLASYNPEDSEEAEAERRAIQQESEE
jgi:twinkle protein